MSRLLAVLLVALALPAPASAGWPLAPTDRPHGVYGTFLNPAVPYAPERVLYRGRTSTGDFGGYHVAIDLPVNDAVPHPAAPAGTTHPVFAVEAGTVTRSSAPDGGPLPAEGCYVGSTIAWSWRVTVGRFDYGHIRPAVEVGQELAEGALVGWTCAGSWHLHLEEREGPGWSGRYVNPIRPAGVLPFADTAPPRVVRYSLSEPRFKIRGRFSASVLVGDRWPYTDWPGAPVADLHPWRVRFVLRRGPRILSKTELTALHTPRPLGEHYNLSLATRTMPVGHCAEHRHGPDASCQPALWVRAFTGRLQAGRYRLTTIVWDAGGNRAERSTTLRVTR